MNSVLLFNVRRISLRAALSFWNYTGLFYLAAVLEKKGYDPHVFHGGIHEVPEVLERERSKRNIVAVGFSCDSDNLSAVEELSLFVKKTYCFPVIVGGPQAIDLKEDFFARSMSDYVVRGEGEETLPVLLDCIVKQKGKREEIAGISWMDDEKGLIVNPDREPPADLDSLPYPAYHCSLHKDYVYGRTVFTGRGCPFSCAFCYQSNHKKHVRMRDIKMVIEEIRHNLNMSPSLKYIAVLDDIFTLNPQRVEEFCNGIKELRKERDFAWYCEGHGGILARYPEMLDLMARSGLIRLQIGVESGSQEVLDTYGKDITIENIEFVVKEAVKAGIPQMATNFITGGPGENEKTMEATMAFAEKLLHMAPGIIDILTGFLRPYPGTAIRENPESFGLTISDKESLKSTDDYPVVFANDLTAEDIILYRLRLSKHIFRVMNDLLEKGKIPGETILSHYRNALFYGVNSLWYTEVFKKNQFLDEYCRLVVKGAAVPFDKVPEDELMKWRPLRTMEIRKAVNLQEGFPRIGKHILSPLEFEVLLRSSAKMRFEEVLESLYRDFGSRFDGQEDFYSSIKEIIHTFDERYWVVFCRL